MRVVIESKIPFIKGVLEPLGIDVVYLSPEKINAETVADADALIVRTRTQCNAALLGNSRVTFVATATIGTDHLDLPYLQSRGITAVNAPGCNAPAVAQYVWSVINRWRPNLRLTVGVVGVGHVGSIVARWGQSMGHTMLLCDPPRAAAEGPENFVGLDEIADKADVITFHTPLSPDGDYPTYHLASDALMQSLRKKPLLINSSRGSVADTSALIKALDNNLLSAVAIDTWEDEPDINTTLLNKAFIATPHIAGYSLEGKKRATTMVLDSLTSHFKLPEVAIADPAPLLVPSAITPSALCYNPMADTLRLKASPSEFELLRNNYTLRHEPLNK